MGTNWPFLKGLFLLLRAGWHLRSIGTEFSGLGLLREMRE